MVDIYQQFRNFKSLDFEFTDEAGTQRKIICSIKNLEHDRIIVIADGEKNEGNRANVGDILRINVYTDDGIYTSNSSVIALEVTADGVIYSLSYPTESKHSQRREYFRAEIPIPFEMIIFTEDGEQLIQSVAKNICGKGICYVSSRPFPKYKSINLSLRFKDREVKTAAELVYTRTVIESSRPKFIHAFTFLTIEQHDIEYIVEECFISQLSRTESKG